LFSAVCAAAPASDHGRMELGVEKWDGLGSGVLLTAEYERLKEEQIQRIGTRDNLVYATLASIAAVVVGAYQARLIDILLLLAPGCVVLGWTYLVNDEKISAIGRYIRVELGPRLSALAEGSPVFGWETAHRSDRRRRGRKVLQLFVDLMIFCLPGMIAVVVRLTRSGVPIIIVAIAIAETVLVSILAVQIVVNADLHRDGRPASPKTRRAAAEAAGRPVV
jgi:hypothetical protein